MKIQVLQEDINAGIRGDCNKCPLALALGRVFGKNVMVGTTIFFIYNNKYNLPDKAQKFRDSFDHMRYFRKLRLRPFQFDIKLN